MPEPRETHAAIDARRNAERVWDWRGGSLWLDREEWGVVIDALITHRDDALVRKAVNSESTSDVRADICVRLIQRITCAALDAAPSDPATDTGGEDRG